MSQLVLQARWLLPIDAMPIENGCMVVEDGRIVSVGPHDPAMHVDEDFGDAVILPGFVNTHTHLELTHLHDAIPYDGSFVDWLRQMPAKVPRANGPEAAAASMRDGLKQSYEAGVTLVGDISNGEVAATTWRDALIRVCGWLEVMGINDAHEQRVGFERTPDGVKELCNHYDRTPDVKNTMQLGVTPHAPYTTSASMYRRAIDYCRETHRSITTHLAETREEYQFLNDGTGPLRDMLEAFDLWDDSFDPPGCTPVQYAEQLDLLPLQPILAHVNYVDDADLSLLAKHRSHVAFCPRSHRFFEHAPHRYRDMLAAGINVCIGTDSLASNETLSVLDELRFLRSQDSTLTDAALLALGTLAGARALGRDTMLGSLTPGKCADFAVVPLDQSSTHDPQADVLRSASRVRQTHVGTTAF